MISISETVDGVIFSIRVQPRARKDAIIGELGDALKVSLKAPPVDGRANQACMEFLAAVLGVPRSSVSIVAGLTSRRKLIHVTGLSAEEVRAKLGF